MAVVEYDQYEQATPHIIANLKNMGINCLAIDFDKTLITSHTEGKWKGDPSNLIESIRPIFVSLIPKADAAGIRVIIVTFSPQVKLIREVLAGAFPTVPEMVVRGSDETWKYSGVNQGKQGHIASAFEELASRLGTSTAPTVAGPDSSSSACSSHAPTVTRSSTLLIDDDVKNIRAALKYDTPAILYNAYEHESEFVKSLLALPPGSA